MKTKNVELIGNEIIIRKMNHPSCVTSFIRCVNLCIKRKVSEVTITFDCSQDSIFPDACLPISALIKFYPAAYNINFSVTCKDDSYLSKCGFLTPFDLGTNEIQTLRNPLDKIFVFTEEREREGQVANLVQSYINCLSRTAECADGVLNGLIWCINEVMDNVLVHSEAKLGFVMAHITRKRKPLFFVYMTTEQVFTTPSKTAVTSLPLKLMHSPSLFKKVSVMVKAKATAYMAFMKSLKTTVADLLFLQANPL